MESNQGQQRAYWLKTLHQWHWISSALCLIGMLLFSATGITLNHAQQIKATPVVETRNGQLPESLQQQLQGASQQGPLPQALADWLGQEFGIQTGDRAPEWSDGEVYLALPRPGGDAWVSVDLDSGEVEYERTDRGWISYFNDLHKGRNTGTAWSWFIDVFAVATMVFAITGLFLLQLHSSRRPATWPMVGLGLVIPLLLAILFIH